MHATAAPPPPVIAPALAVLDNASELLIRSAEDVRAARLRIRPAEIDRTSARAMGAAGRALEQVGRIEGECALIRAALAHLTWEIPL